MPVRTIKTKKPPRPGSAQSLVDEVRKRTSSIPGNQENRVLVVFRDGLAKIYYECEPRDPDRTRRRSRSSAA
jgi:hypothetical protein